MTDALPLLFADFETRSRADLKRVGGRQYAADPSTEVICCALCLNGDLGFVVEWRCTDPPPKWLPSDAGTFDVVGNNVLGFDRHIWRRLGWPEPRRWIDTAVLARRRGIRASLAAMGEAFLGRAKDMAGNKFTLALSQPSRAAARLGQLPELTPDVIDRVVAYCRDDVEINVGIWPFVRDWLDAEPDVESVDTIVNDRGVVFDRELAAALIAIDHRHASAELGIPLAAVDDVAFRAALDAAGVRMPKSAGAAWVRKLREKRPDMAELLDARIYVSGLRHPATFVRWIRDAGADVADSTEESVTPLLDHPSGPVRDLARGRLAVAGIIRGKLEAGLARCSSDGRLRDNVRAYAAHTWRWGGAGLQMQNMPRPSGKPSKWTDADVCAAADLVKAGHVDDFPREAMAVMLRACIVAPPGHALAVADYGAVESRGTAWVARDEPALEVFRSGRDVYINRAAGLFELDYDTLHTAYEAGDPLAKSRRQLGKVCELGLGYQMGATKFEATAAAPPYNVDWKSIGLDPADVVRTWRAQRSPVVEFWHDLEFACKAAVRDGVATSVGPMRVARVDGDVWIMLPSGRPIVYPRMGLVKEPYVDDRRGRGMVRESLVYHGAKGREYTYGGKLTENVVQAICRDLLAAGLVAAEREGLRPVLHVHDEIVCEVPCALADDALETLIECMTNAPAWADGFPLTAEGFTCTRYRK